MLDAGPNDGNYTLWLSLCAEDEAWARHLIDNFASELGTERFDPHVTILGGLSSPNANREAEIAALAQAYPAFEVPIAEIAFLPEIFRAFFLKLAAHPTLDALNRQAEGFGSIYPNSGYMPHVSLIYGELTADAKEDLRARLQEEVRGRSLRFDRLSYVYSGKGIEIADWRVDYEVALG